MTLQNYKRFLSVAKITAVFFYCTAKNRKAARARRQSKTSSWLSMINSILSRWRVLGAAIELTNGYKTTNYKKIRL